jgi:hypothetical protein
MAKGEIHTYDKPKVSRPKVHSKTKTSCSKTSKLYKKKNVGQGK